MLTLNKIRLLLIPFSWVYGMITHLRNWMYDIRLFDSYIIPQKSICVGNLSVGGTGKTPHVAFLAQFLSPDFSVQILSRGYGRKTKGFVLLDENATAKTVGDEPLFYYRNFAPKVQVAVCESRVHGVQELAKIQQSDILLLDDAYQHRAVQAGVYILLTDFNAPFYSDFVLPAGNLREFRSGLKRTDYVIVTKCPSALTEIEKEKIRKRIGIPSDQIYFSEIVYSALVPFSKTISIDLESIQSALVVTGIANPTSLHNHLKGQFEILPLSYSDHHTFTAEEIQEIHKKFDTFAERNTIIVTTEKDYMRLHRLIDASVLEKYPWFYQQISVKLDRESHFKQEIKNYVDTI